MKKKYHIPTIEIIALDTTEVMVPNSQFDPGVGGANSYAFDEEENEGWGEFNPDKPENYLWN